MRKIMLSFVAVTIACFVTSGVAWTPDANELADQVRKAISNYYHGYADIENPVHGHINVETSATDEGKITLEGQTSTLYDKYRIHNIVSKVPGVIEISNQLVVEAKPLPDNIIKNNIMEEMRYNRAIIERDGIKIAINDGQVILSGKVSYYYEKELIQTVASWQEGVRAIQNNIEVMRPEKALSDENLQKVLRDILDNQFPTDKNTVTITIDEGVVTVKGKVDDLWSKQNIEEEFSEVIGVLKVYNYLQVAS